MATEAALAMLRFGFEEHLLNEGREVARYSIGKNSS